MNVTRNFSNAEISCRCGCGAFPKREAQLKLQAMRTLFGGPITVTSGARCLRHNTRIGSTPTSSHVVNAATKQEGLAFDISIANRSESEILYLVLCAGRAGFERIAINRSANFIHVDDDATKTSKHWNY
jgi:uncharacterized protein YcbK (DUF882 family)